MEEVYIKIYSYKKVKIGEECLDVLHLEDIALSNKEWKYKIVSGKYQGKVVDLFDENYDSHDFCAIPVSLVEKNLMTDFNPEDTSKINLENYKKKSKYEYYKVEKVYDKPFLKETDDAKVIEAFKHFASPSLSSALDSLISTSPDRLVIPPDLVSQMLGREDSLTLQDPNSNNNSLKDWNISEKYNTLRKRIIGLDQELRILLANINKNISLSYTDMEPSKIKELKSNILILGPRGSGKTFMIENIADLFGVPYAIEDATRYTPSAYVGFSVEEILINLYRNSGENKKMFEHGIIFLDEFDKICKKMDPKDHAIKEATQDGLLTILRGTKVNLKVRKGPIEVPLMVDTSKLTFVLSGAFEEIIDSENITSKDLVKYGMIPQLADRITLTIRTKNPTRENLKEALVNGEYSYLKLLEEYLKIYNIPLLVNENFIDYIVSIASLSNSGYRGLTNAITKCLNDILFELYAGKLDEVKLMKELKGGIYE